MDIAQIGTVLGAIIAAAGIAGAIYVLVKVKANESAIAAQREFISVQAQDIENLKGKLAESNTELTSMRKENATLMAAVTQRAEVKALHDAEDQHHVEAMGMSKQIVDLLTQNTAVLLQIKEALDNVAN